MLWGGWGRVVSSSLWSQKGLLVQVRSNTEEGMNQVNGVGVGRITQRQEVHKPSTELDPCFKEMHQLWMPHTEQVPGHKRA